MADRRSRGWVDRPMRTCYPRIAVIEMIRTMCVCVCVSML